ncbi:guanitoxin biosynthesis heme-dependent pre-guanitoxin N-hydroxylase GntA [Alteromonas sp. ASW11-130]|uniref:guanitoxin biosynthesis heme-dependent pre-guanitoxin N-hydroxylase GntA n=1 Tax=Alteromonas sp. ASW11-130 TaxID=3015775 RepID=UPI0022422F06|nr:guanitoxin biosynthesis heme-dependent pre-guanitoxin N-hydroxylase GntA [Alteromonas sp. ASW11-130]MCW8092334.1 YqcI/YcgG family protein [Alteromonas sp. ASW11-130]
MSCRKPFVEDGITEFIAQKAFPCLGAKTALAKENLCINCYGDIANIDNTADILGDLYHFIDEFDIHQTMYSSFICVFEESDNLDEKEFETALWEKLQSMHDLDSRLCRWDPHVAKDPQNSHFSFSIGEHGFFVIGLNPNSSRRSRQFEFPAIVFNLHQQFEYLREQGRFEHFRDTIRERDTRFSGSANPMLASHGESSEVYQYSGRKIEQNWTCPFKQKA